VQRNNEGKRTRRKKKRWDTPEMDPEGRYAASAGTKKVKKTPDRRKMKTKRISQRKLRESGA